MRNTDYVLIDAKTGFVVSRHSVPARLFPPPDGVPAGKRLVATAGNDTLPVGPWRFDLRKVRDAFNIVPSYMDAVTAWRPEPKSEKSRFAIAREGVIEKLDRDYAQRFKQLAGPLSALHAEKRRQAEAGGGPLIVDEEDRQAILTNAAAQDEALAKLEAVRRDKKRRLRAALTFDELQTIMREPENEIRS